VAIGSDRKAGDALEAVLRARDSGAEPGSGRTLFLALLSLHAAGMLTFESGDAVHGPRARSGAGAVGRNDAGDPETGHPYNMPSLSASGQAPE